MYFLVEPSGIPIPVPIPRDFEMPNPDRRLGFKSSGFEIPKSVRDPLQYGTQVNFLA
jgi:hypothetical protein